MQSRLPFNSPEMAQPTNNRRGVLTRSAAKALRENNNHVSVSYDSNLVIKSSKKSQGMADNNNNNNNKNMMMTSSSPADVLTPPRKKVLFADDTEANPDKENATSSSSLRRTRASTPFRSSKAVVEMDKKVDDDDDDDNDNDDDVITEEEPVWTESPAPEGNAQTHAYYSVPSITVESETTEETVVEPPVASFQPETNSTFSLASGWALHVAFLLWAAYWLAVEQVPNQAASSDTFASEGISMDP